MIGVNALCFLQCFDTVCWVAGRTSKKPVTLMPTFSSGTNGGKQKQNEEIVIKMEVDR